jgi:hypothetical protein
MTTPAQEEMAGVRSLRRSSLMLGLTAAACAATGLAASQAQAGTVGPRQYCTGVINGKDGDTTILIIIRMACAGPVKPGETGRR